MAKDSLRTLSSTVPDREEAEEIMLHLQRQSDRSAAIVGSSIVESMLQELITIALKSAAEDLPGRLFENRGPLSDFNSKILIAQAFGLISDSMASDLQRIRKIRNCFAHARVHVEFETPAIAREVAELAAVMAVRAAEAQNPPEQPSPYSSHKTSFGLSCYISMHILRQKLETQPSDKSVPAD